MDLTALNFHHLFCFWMIALEGSVVAAAKRLRLSQPTLSAHLRQFEEHLGTQLFVRAGRRLVLTEAGRTAFAYAERIFSTAQEFVDTLSGRHSSAPVLRVGVVENFPHLVALRFFERVLKLRADLRLLAVSMALEQLLAKLMNGEISLVLADTAALRSYSRQFQWIVLEASPLALYAPVRLADRVRSGGLQALAGRPFLLPGPSCPLRQKVERWLNTISPPPDVIGEIDNSALLKALATSKGAFFVMPYVEAKQLERLYHVRHVHVIEDVRQHYYIVAQRSVLPESIVAQVLSLLPGTNRAQGPGKAKGRRASRTGK
ncbi:MAG: LysR family transcriptional regulator [Candidatus Sumerlaeaceae bacterium]